MIPVVSITSSGAIEGRAADPNTLIDEQDTVPEKPTYENSMYFDEIYHARTGYEHAHSLYTYETTHPPLGKVFMSWCIDLMGMTPFAWRFAGTVTGILMIPAIYLLAMQLMKRTRWAALSALLLTADCMHFTQTRIATIDSFPVLFMMVMFLFMARWMQMSFYHQKLWKTLVPLFFSGVFMGAGRSPASGLAVTARWGWRCSSSRGSSRYINRASMRNGIGTKIRPLRVRRTVLCKTARRRWRRAWSSS